MCTAALLCDCCVLIGLDACDRVINLVQVKELQKALAKTHLSLDTTQRLAALQKMALNSKKSKTKTSSAKSRS